MDELKRIANALEKIAEYLCDEDRIAESDTFRDNVIEKLAGIGEAVQQIDLVATLEADPIRPLQVVLS